MRKRRKGNEGKGRKIGRGEVIRTLDPLHPMQVRYQAALRPDRTGDYSSVARYFGTLKVNAEPMALKICWIEISPVDLEPAGQPHRRS